MESTEVLIAPVVTEKSSKAQANRKYAFMVHLLSNKIDVKKAVEQAYGVKVSHVNLFSVLRKVRFAGAGRMITKRHQGKRAIVTVAQKQSIDFNKIKV